ncbi:uncharacterized protein LOC115741957 isoform X2 [Rhodamnia argentea]|uniref:Uncharacterized protein LOC115741957 isoform X2 n=1 Tax=Rhodamnia argentea TaxID=178133 RepID=A0ABM3HQW7_9MYRT|nr:uncharacterized protein LOC115741957 isoform X2 [Rhodamnia argentea]
MMVVVEVAHPHHCRLSTPFPLSSARRRASSSDSLAPRTVRNYSCSSIWPPKMRLPGGARSSPPPPSESPRLRPVSAAAAPGVPSPPLDLTEENIRLVLADARVELAQIFDTSVGITGQVELAELDGPFVKISLKGRFWHERSMVLARVGNYLKQRIPILEVDIEDEKQLDDSPENF